MKCKNCKSSEALIDNDTMYSSHLCLDCGYYIKEDGQEEIEILPFCLLIIDDVLYQPIAAMKALLNILRTYRAKKGQNKIVLRKFFAETSTFKEKSFFLWCWILK